MAFDFDTYAETSEAVRWSDLDFDVFDEMPLDADTLRTVRYMCDVEYHTTCFVRELLVTPSHREDAPAAFMTMWNREEFWHGEALAAVLKKHGIHVDYDEIKAKRAGLGWKLALGPAKQSLLSNMVGSDFIAVHMAWGAANELSATAGYRRMAAMQDHP
ncbi:ferritin-like domain-containing protein, partial [Geobacillus sp. MMMUD3]|nr:ferritin-like domain-containing protein [Geobacillus sp. MMMUD3]